MLEKQIEAKFLKACTVRGWLALKQNVIGRRGYPDRLVITQEGLHVWVELKTEKGILSEGQKAALDNLRAHGAQVCVAYGPEEALKVIYAIEAGKMFIGVK